MNPAAETLQLIYKWHNVWGKSEFIQQPTPFLNVLKRAKERIHDENNHFNRTIFVTMIISVE